MQTLVNAAPRNPAAAECHFYHTTDLPSGEHFEGHWDLRPVIDAYLGRVPLAGKSFLDVGAASGFLSFAAERLGASRVVSFDASADTPLIPIPWIENESIDCAAGCAVTLEGVKNSYWYCHNAYGSRAACVYGGVHNLDGSLGVFDVVMAGCILLHLTDPFRALMQIARRVSGKLVITELDPFDIDTAQPILLPNFCRSRSRSPDDIMSWWQFPPACLSLFLDTMGFETLNIERFTMRAPLVNQIGRFYSLVAQRRA